MDSSGVVTVLSTVSGVVTKIMKTQGKSVRKKERLLFIKKDGEEIAVAVENLTSVSGSVAKVLVAVDDRVDEGTILVHILPCKHPAIYKNICASCGDKCENFAPAVGDSNVDGGVGNDNGNGNDGNRGLTSAYHMKSSQGLLRLSQQEADKVANLQYDNLTKQRKLALVLDIDHTIAHCVEDQPAVERTYKKGGIGHSGATTGGGCTGSVELALTPDFECVVHPLVLAPETSGVRPQRYLVKFRPYVMDFLRKASLCYQMTLYTSGTRKYAEAIADLLDPDQKLFNRRIVARTDMFSVARPEIGAKTSSAFVAASTVDFSNYENPSFSSSVNNIHEGVYDGNKSLSLLFLKATSLVVIVDDRDDVWATAVDQLLLIEPYKFFKDAVEVYNRTGNNSGVNGAGAGAGSAVGRQPSGASALITHRSSGSGSGSGNEANAFVESDSILQRYMDVLTMLHGSVYDATTSGLQQVTDAGVVSLQCPDPDRRATAVTAATNSVVPVMISLKNSVLRGCHIQFQGFWHKDARPAEIRANLFVQHALRLGATVQGADGINTTDCIDDSDRGRALTHVVSKCLDSDFALWFYYCSHYTVSGSGHAQQDSEDGSAAADRCEEELRSVTGSPLPPLAIVTLDWLMQSVFHLKRADETQHRKYKTAPPVEAPVRERRSVETVSVPQLAGATAQGAQKRAFNETFQPISNSSKKLCRGVTTGGVSFNSSSDIASVSASVSVSASASGSDDTDDEDFDNWCSSL
jgi:hypothetical protein